MSTELLEQKILDLTSRVQKLESMARPEAKPSWKKAIGSAKGDALDQEAARLGAEWRAQENQRR